MSIADFKSSLAKDGFTEVLNRELPADTVVSEHDHPFDARALILSGEITLMVDGVSQTYREGDVFNMAAGCRHQETIGSDGVSFISGRRYT